MLHRTFRQTARLRGRSYAIVRCRTLTDGRAHSSHYVLRRTRGLPPQPSYERPCALISGRRLGVFGVEGLPCSIARSAKPPDCEDVRTPLCVAVRSQTGGLSPHPSYGWPCAVSSGRTLGVFGGRCRRNPLQAPPPNRPTARTSVRHGTSPYAHRRAGCRHTDPTDGHGTLESATPTRHRARCPFSSLPPFPPHISSRLDKPAPPHT